MPDQKADAAHQEVLKLRESGNGIFGRQCVHPYIGKYHHGKKPDAGDDDDLLVNAAILTGRQMDGIGRLCGWDFFAAFQSSRIFCGTGRTAEGVADKVTENGGGRTADHSIHGIELPAWIGNEKNMACGL